jgi:hypothetical protein
MSEISPWAYFRVFTVIYSFVKFFLTDSNIVVLIPANFQAWLELKNPDKSDNIGQKRLSNNAFYRK